MLGSARNYRFLREARWPAIDPSTDSVAPIAGAPFTDRGRAGSCTSCSRHRQDNRRLQYRKGNAMDLIASSAARCSNELTGRRRYDVAGAWVHYYLCWSSQVILEDFLDILNSNYGHLKFLNFHR